MATKTNVEPITAEQLAEFIELDNERKRLEQAARLIEKRTDTLKSHFRSHLEAKGKTSLKKDGYEVHLEDGRPIVSYQKILVEKIGPLAVDEIVANAPKSVKVVVQKL